MRTIDSPPTNPFPGLRPFRSDEHHLFFGREEQTSALLQLLRTNRFLAVVGTSGSGKSSLVRAGMIAELYGGTMTQAGSTWEVMILRPGGSPIENLARAFVDAQLYDPEDPSTLPRLLATLNRSRFGLVEAMKQCELFEPGTNLLVVVDQFEELFRFRQQGVNSEETAAAFVNLLLTASEQSECPIYVTITMRSDYLGDCSEIPGLAEAVNEGEYLIPRLLRDQKRDAIEKPIGVGGARIAPMLVQRLLNDVGDDPDQLPVLQHALMRMWDAWSAGRNHDRPIDFGDFEATGGLGAALSNHADEIYDALPDDRHRSACEKIFKTLTEKGDDNRGIRRPTRLSQLQAIADADRNAVTTVLEAYRGAGVTFLMPGTEVQLDDRTVLDLSHESLMRGWERLRMWVEDEAQSARIFRRLLDTARLWSDGKAGLFRDPDLQIAVSWREQEAPNSEWAEQYGGDFETAIGFLETSNTEVEAERQARETARRRELEQAQQLAEAQQLRLEQQQRAARRLRSMLAGLAVVAAIAVMTSIVAGKFWQAANVAKLDAEKSEELAKQNAVKAEQSALEANRLSDAARQAEQAMQRTATQAAAERNTAQRESYRSTVKLAESMLQGNEEAKFRVADILWQTQPELRAWEWGYLMAQSPLEEWSLQTDATGLRSAVGTVDGRFLITAGIGGTVALWDLESRQQVWQQAAGRVHQLAVDRQSRFVGVSTADSALPQFKILELATGNLVHQSDRGGLVECAFSARGEDLYVLESGTLRCIATSTWRQRAQAALMGEGLAGGDPIYNAVFVDEAGKYVGVDHQKATPGQSRFSFFDAQTLGSTTQLAGYNEVGNTLSNPSTPILNSVQGELTYSITSSVYRKTINGERSLLGDLSDYVLYLTVDPVSGAVLSATANGEVQIVDGDGGEHSILHGAPITGLATLPHRRFVTAGADGLVKCWSMTPTESLASRTAAPVFSGASANFVAFTSDGKSLLYRTWDRHNSLYQLDSLSYRHFQYPDRAGNNNVFPMIRPHTNEIVDYSNDGLLFFPGDSGGTDAESTRSIPVSRPFSAAFDDKGQILVVASEDGNPTVFDLESNKPVPDPNVKGNGPVAINPSGSRAAVQTRERLLVWEVATGRLLNSLEAEHNGDAAIPPDFHPEGELIAVLTHIQNSGLDRLVVWNSSLGKTQTTIESQPGVSFNSCKFSADGNRLYALCSDDKVRILDWKLGKELFALTGGANLVHIAVSPDGLTLAYAGYNPNLFFAKSLPWEGETPRSSNFYRAVDDLRLYTVRTAQTINESKDLIEFTNHSDKPIRIDYQQVAILGLVKSKKRTLRAIAPKETVTLSKVRPGTEFLFIDPESSEQLASFTKTDIAITTEEGPVGIKVVLPGRDPMTQAAAEELQGDIAHRQGRPADAIAHYTRAVSIRTSIVRDNPSKASSQGSLAIVFLKNLAVTPADKPDDRTALLQQAISFWHELTQNPDSKLATWQHLLRFQLQLVDHQVAIGAAESKPQVVSLVSFWSKQSKQHPANRLFPYWLSEVSRKLPVVYPDGVDQPTLDSLMGEDPEMAGVIGDAYAGERDWAQAVALYSRGIQQDAPSLGLFAKRAMAYEQKKNWEAASADWLRAAPGNPEWSRRLVALVQRLTDSGEFALAESVRAKARLLFEQKLVEKPEDSASAAELADLLLEASPSGWTVLKPTEMKSEGGATLTLLDDSSILAGGKNPDRDDYALVARPDLEHITAIRLEALPDRSLPLNGPGRSASSGNFHLNQWRVSSGGQPCALTAIQVEFDESGETALAIGGKPHEKRGWGNYPRNGNRNSAVVATNLHRGPKDDLRIDLRFSRTKWVGHNLGRFRLSVTDDPATFGREQRRIAALNLVDPWAKLGAAYLLVGDMPRAADLLAKSAEKGEIAPWQPIGALSDELLDSLKARHPRPYATILSGLATAAAERGQIDQARALYSRLTASHPENALWKERADQLRGGVLAAWYFDQGPGSWRDAHDCQLLAKDGILTVRTTGGDPYFSAPLDGPAGGKSLVLRYRTDEAFTMQVFWSDATGGADESRHGDYRLPASAGAWRDAVIPFSTRGRLTLLRLDPNTAHEHPLEIDSILLRKWEPGDLGQLPSDVGLLTRLGNASQAAGHTREALLLFERASADDPKDTVLSLRVAALQAWFGQEEGLAATRRRILAFAKDNHEAVTAERAAKACVIIPCGDKKQLEEALALGREAVRIEPGGEWNLMALGMAQYRCGQFAEADATLKQTMDQEKVSPVVASNSAFYRAMSLFQQGQADEASKLALVAATKLKPFPADRENPLAGGDFHEDLIQWLAYKEAKSLIQFDAAPAAPKTPDGK